MESLLENPIQLLLGLFLIVSALGVILLPNPVHASLAFLLTLLTLAVFYIQLIAPFIGVMQVLVYAGAILVLFMFVVILFQDAYKQIMQNESKSSPVLVIIAITAMLTTLALMGKSLLNLPLKNPQLAENFGSVNTLGKSLYLDFFFPFEAVVLIFLVAVVGSLYVGKKVKS